MLMALVPREGSELMEILVLNVEEQRMAAVIDKMLDTVPDIERIDVAAAAVVVVVVAVVDSVVGTETVAHIGVQIEPSARQSAANTAVERVVNLVLQQLLIDILLINWGRPSIHLRLHNVCRVIQSQCTNRNLGHIWIGHRNTRCCSTCSKGFFGGLFLVDPLLFSGFEAPSAKTGFFVVFLRFFSVGFWPSSLSSCSVFGFLFSAVLDPIARFYGLPLLALQELQQLASFQEFLIH